MKKIIYYLLAIFCFYAFSFNVNASCNDKDLNDWAEKAEIKLTEYSTVLKDDKGYIIDTGDLDYAYLLYVSPERKDIILKAETGGYKKEAINVPGYNLYAIGGYTSLSARKYEIKIYGSKDSKCPNELLKVINYTVEPYNEFTNFQYCVDYPDAELCAKFKDTTKISEKEFLETMEEYDRKQNPIVDKENIFIKIIKIVFGYGMFIIIPLLIISLYYSIKINKHNKRERKK